MKKLIALCVIGLAFCQPSFADDELEDEDGCPPAPTLESFGERNRIEQEAKITVPEDEVERFFNFISTRYAPDSPHLKTYNLNITTAYGEEFFEDAYYDTPQSHLRQQAGGIRIRTRENTNNPQDRKNGRSLIQVKLSNVDIKDARTELKFLPSTQKRRDKCLGSLSEHERAQVERYDAHPLLGAVLESQRLGFIKLVKQLGLDPEALENVVTIHQKRRRVYFKKNGNAAMTITLDQTSASQLWKRVGFTEVEIELNELAFTEASEGERERLMAFSDTIQHELNQNFPRLQKDQTPKYNKIRNRLDQEKKNDPIFAAVADHETTVAAIFILLTLGGGAVGLFALRKKHSL